MQLFLGIESSCDDTAVALAAAGPGAVSIPVERSAAQARMHEQYGGVVPELAAREHLTNLPLLVDQVLQTAGVQWSDLTAVGVTRGPGLKGCLLMGLGFAKAVALGRNLPLVGVNHIEAHLFAAQLDNPGLDFPFLGMVVSGGHTEIHAVQALGRYELLARTGDDAAGEAFDKSANLLGFTYPGGPALASLADTVSRSRFKLPRVMREAEGFSFSGLKTAIALLVKEQRADLEQDQELRAELAHAVQAAIVDALVFKLKRAAAATGIKRVALTGGVAANGALREGVRNTGLDVFLPQPAHCMDNGAMVAFLTALRFARGDRLPLSADVLPRWPLETVCG